MLNFSRIVMIVFWGIAGTSSAAKHEPPASLTAGKSFAADWGKMRVTGVVVSPDGSKLAAVASSAEQDKPAGRLVVFDIKSAKPELELPTDERLHQVAWLSKERIAARGDAGVRVWDVRSKAVLRVIGEKDVGGPLRAIAVVPGVEAVAVLANSARPVTLWDSAAGEGKALWNEGQPTEVASLSFDAAGGLLAVGGYQKRLIRIWDLKAGKLVADLGAEGVKETRDVVMSPDGTHVVAEAPNSIVDTLHDGEGRAIATMNAEAVLYNVKKGTPMELVSAFGTSVHPVAISPDGLSIVAGTTSSLRNRLAVYMNYGGLFFLEKPIGGILITAAFVDDEGFIASSIDGAGVSHVVAYRLVMEPEFKQRALEHKAKMLGQ